MNNIFIKKLMRVKTFIANRVSDRKKIKMKFALKEEIKNWV